jgi:hypothetical protein
MNVKDCPGQCPNNSICCSCGILARRNDESIYAFSGRIEAPSQERWGFLFFHTGGVMANPIQSFAAQHWVIGRGYRAFPRWFGDSDFWKSLCADHRAVLHELYNKIASQPTPFGDSGFTVQRGQWPVSYEALAKDAGASKQQTRTAIEKAKAAGIIQHSLIYISKHKLTRGLNLFSWVDFDSYDTPNTPPNITVNTAANITGNTAVNTAVNTIIHNSNTHVTNTPLLNTPMDNTRREDLTVAAPPLLPLPGAGASAGENDLDEEGEEVDEDAGQVATCSAERQSFDPINGLTPKDVARILASHESVRDWLLYGMDGVNEKDEAKRKLLPPAIWNWRRFVVDFKSEPTTEASLGLRSWTVQSWVGFYWYRVSFWRNERGIAQGLPKFAKLCRIIENLTQQRTPMQMYLLISGLTQHFDLLCCMLRGIGDGIQLDESTLDHPHMRPAVDYLLAASETKREEYYNIHAAKIAERWKAYHRPQS